MDIPWSWVSGSGARRRGLRWTRHRTLSKKGGGTSMRLHDPAKWPFCASWGLDFERFVSLERADRDYKERD